MILPNDDELKERVKEWISNNSGKTFENVYFGALCVRDLIKTLNTPQKPKFPEWVQYFGKDENRRWYYFEFVPYFDTDCWLHKRGRFDPVLKYDQILWLEHVNAGREPKDSLVKLEDY